ncbi:MAG TPA: hypothetical protein VGI93_20915 [Steroidobacteraceae bacterium]|jgi:hypothetical protein
MKRQFLIFRLIRPSAAALVLTAILLPSLFGSFESRAADRINDCRIGIYQLNNGESVDIGATDGDHLRWRRNDGTTGLLSEDRDKNWTSTLGWTGRPDGKRVSFPACETGQIKFDGVTGRRIALDVTNVTFSSAGAQLAGRLVMPKGDARVPIVVLLHGSEDFSARDFYSMQRQFPAEGIGVFVYDKRGTGASGGRYTQNYLVLADDAIAAMNEAQRLAGARAGRIGYQGGSQAGWVAPLAAKIASVDFVIVGFGLAVSPIEEDRESIALDMTDRHYGPEIMAKAMEVADATAVIVRSDFRDGYDRLAAVRARYGNEPWFKYVHGDITFFFLETAEAKLREEGPTLLAGVAADYDPMPVLQYLDTPQLWILGADDHDAPSAETERQLRNLQSHGKLINIAVFPHTEHGIYEYEVTPEGERVDTRNPDGYFKMMCDFIKSGRTQSAYGNVTVTRAPHNLDAHGNTL